jgi:hypothetical protein
MYLVAVEGRGLMVAVLPPHAKDNGRDVRAIVGRQFGVTAAQVLVHELEPGCYELSQFTVAFGVTLPKLVTAVPEKWELEDKERAQ